MKDQQGNTIHAGDYFAYATRDGNSANMHFGLVLEVSENDFKCVVAKHGWISGERRVGWEPAKNSQRFGDRTQSIVVSHESLRGELIEVLDQAAASRGFVRGAKLPTIEDWRHEC